MSDAPASVWVVASAEACARWCPALEAAGLDAHALAWSDVAVGPGTATVAARLAEGGFDLVLLTSRNAVGGVDVAGADAPPAACVGAGTAAAARDAGFEVALVGERGGRALAEQVVAAHPAARRVLFLRGADARTEARDTLAAAGIEVVEVVTYAMAPRADFAARVADAPAPAIVVLGSPRAAEALAAAGGGSGAIHLGMGALTLEAARGALGVEARLAEGTGTAGVVAAVRAASREDPRRER